MLAPLTAACIALAADMHQVPEEFLWALLAQEAGRVGSAVRNSNGTLDLGPFQINTVHVPAVASRWNVSQEEARRRLRDDGCAIAEAAAHHLKQKYLESGDWVAAIGRYHSKTPPLAQAYITAVAQKYRRLFQPSAPSDGN